MNDAQLERRLNSVGKGCFVDYFHRFSDWSLTNQDISEILQEEMGYMEKASLTRVSGALRIIKAGRAIDALEIVRGSRAEARIRERAAEIADNLRRERRT